MSYEQFFVVAARIHKYENSNANRNRLLQRTGQPARNATMLSISKDDNIKNSLIS